MTPSEEILCADKRELNTCRGSPKSAGRQAGPDGVGGDSAPGRSRPTSAHWGRSLPRRISNEKLELKGKQTERQTLNDLQEYEVGNMSHSVLLRPIARKI